MSKTIFACSPRNARPITSLTCSSRQARRQRVHWMQASRLTAMAGCDRSCAGCARAAKRGLPTPELRGPLVDLVVARVVALGHVGQQQFEHQLLRLDGAFAVGRDLHARARGAAARRRQHALAADLDHAGAAVADFLEPGLVAEVRDLDAFALGDLDDRFVRAAADLAAVELEADRRRIERGSFLAGDRIHVSDSMAQCATRDA